MSQTCFACDGGFTQTWDTAGAGIIILHLRELDREERYAPPMRSSVRWGRTQAARETTFKSKRSIEAKPPAREGTKLGHRNKNRTDL